MKKQFEANGVVQVDGRSVLDIAESLARARSNYISLVVEVNYGTELQDEVESFAKDQSGLSLGFIEASQRSIDEGDAFNQLIRIEEFYSAEKKVKQELTNDVNVHLALGRVDERNRHLQTMLTNAQIGFTDPLEQV